MVEAIIPQAVVLDLALDEAQVTSRWRRLTTCAATLPSRAAAAGLGAGGASHPLADESGTTTQTRRDRYPRRGRPSDCWSGGMTGPVLEMSGWGLRSSPATGVSS